MQQDVFTEGKVLLINKPYDWSSFDVVRKVRSLLKIKKIGHAGTLDPLATGLLILCTGKYTRKINEYMSREKEYTGIITLGATTPSYDLESIPENFIDTRHITAEAVSAAARQFTGEIWQVPPVFSAIKKDGKRAYELARRGKEVELSPRKIVISEFSTELHRRDTPSPVAADLSASRYPQGQPFRKKQPDESGASATTDPLSLPGAPVGEGSVAEVRFRVVCSTGTYIRSLAHDLGKALGCGGYLRALCRTRIGEFQLKDAWSMEELPQRIRELREGSL